MNEWLDGHGISPSDCLEKQYEDVIIREWRNGPSWLRDNEWMVERM